MHVCGNWSAAQHVEYHRVCAYSKARSAVRCCLVMVEPTTLDSRSDHRSTDCYRRQQQQQQSHLLLMNNIEALRHRNTIGTVHIKRAHRGHY
jgi:hypothetical protein